SARAVAWATCRSSSAMFRCRGSTGVGFRPRFLGVKAASSPRARARRHTTKCDEYNPSRRSNAPTAPGVAQASAALRIRRLYSAVNTRRCAFATTCTSSPVVSTSPLASMGLSSLALYTNYLGSDCLIHVDTEGGAQAHHSTY